MKFLDHLEEWLIAFLMGAATLLIFVAVVHRYAAGLPIPGVQDALLEIDLSWAQELCIYMFVWMAKFGAAYGVRTGIHVGVDVMINRLPPAHPQGLRAVRPRSPVRCSPASSARWARRSSGTSATPTRCRPTSKLPKWIVYLCIPLGSYLMCFRFLQVAWTFARTGELPHHDVAHVEGIEEPINPYEMADNLHPADLRTEAAMSAQGARRRMTHRPGSPLRARRHDTMRRAGRR